MEKAADDHEEEIAVALCEKILRNYPNNDLAVEACADCNCKLFIHSEIGTTLNVYTLLYDNS